MSNESISHAYVKYTNGLQTVVPISSIRQFVPKNNKDFVKNKKYKVWFDGGKNKDNLLLNGHILLLGTSESDVLDQRTSTRLKFPNKRNISFSSTEAGPSGSKLRRKQKKSRAALKQTVKARKKLNYDREAAKQHQNKNILEKYSKLLKTRKALDDSLSEDTVSDTESEDYGDNEIDFSRQDESFESQEDVDDKDDTNGDSESESRNGLSNRPPSPPQQMEQEPVLHPRQNRSPSPPQQLEQEPVLHPRQNRSPSPPQQLEQEPILHPRQNRSPSPRQRLVQGPVLHPRQNRSPSPPQQLEQEPVLHPRQNRPPSPPQRLIQEPVLRLHPNRVEARHAGARYIERIDDQPQNLVYLNADTPINEDTWELMKMKSDSTFVREIAVTLWGTETLQRKCMNTKIANKGNRGVLREQLSPRKYETVKSCLYAKLTENGITGTRRAIRMTKVSKYMSAKLYDVRRKLPKP